MKFSFVFCVLLLADLPLGWAIPISLDSNSNDGRPKSIVRRSPDSRPEEAQDEGHLHLASLIAKIKKTTDESCGHYIGKILHTLKYTFAKKHRNHAYISEPEAKLWSNLNDNENGVEVLSNTMRVLGNYSLADGIRAGEVWTVEDHNNVISCLENIHSRLEEHTENEYGDPLYQGDMAATKAGCSYSEHSKKVAEELFTIGTRGCVGLNGCQFEHPDEAVHFCNNEPECTLIMGKLDSNGCDGGFGCYVPRKGIPKSDDSWSAGGGRTFVKHCPGVLTQVVNAVRQGLKTAGNRWDSGVVNYCFASDVMDVGQEAFHLAVEAIKRQVPCLLFNLVARNNDTHCNVIPSIVVQSKRSGCWSYIGQVSGKERGWLHRSQPLNLDRGCSLQGLALHQLSHALGMIHETARADRDKHVYWNESATQEGKDMEFSLHEDVVKYAWHGFDQCVSRAGRTKLTMNTSDCIKLQGSYEGAANSMVECQLDLCEDGIYFPAPMGMCKEKVANVAIMLKRKDCTMAKGVPSAVGEGDEPSTEDWADCHFDFCTDMGLHIAKPYSCANKLAYGYVEISHNDCKNMKGSYSVSKDAQSGATDWANCYFDFCAGVFDAPFDFLSLMTYSPWSWAKLSPEGKPLGRTLIPKGNYSERITTFMGQRMGYSGLDVFRLGHMYGCWDKIHPDFDSQDVSHSITTGDLFKFTGYCEDVLPEYTGYDIHGESGFMKHASCTDLEKHCKDKNKTMREEVRLSCPVTCFACMPGNWNANGSKAGPCFDAINTGIRFRDGPKATCTDLRNYCNHSAIGAQVREACKISCGLCELHVEGPFLDTWGRCEDEQTEDQPQFTIGGKIASCPDMEQFCYDHPDSYLVRHKCPKTCGGCGLDDTTTKTPTTDEIYIPGDSGGCDRRRRFGFCSSRRRRNI